MSTPISKPEEEPPLPAKRSPKALLIIPVCAAIFVGAVSILYNYSPSQRVETVEQQVIASPSPVKPTAHDRLVQIQDATRNQNVDAAAGLVLLIPHNAPEYKEAQKLIAAAKAERAAEDRARAPQLRETLRNEYEQLLTDANPHLNYIGSKLTKTKGGYALWATHEYFSEYSFSMGPDAKLVSDWMSSRHSELLDAGIVSVGVMGRGFGGYVAFHVN